MNATSSNRNMSRRLLGIGGTLKLLAFQVILVATIASALVAFQAGIASADTGTVPTQAQTQTQTIADDSHRLRHIHRAGRPRRLPLRG